MRSWVRRLDDVHHPANGMLHYSVLGRAGLQALSPDRLEAMLQSMPNRRDRALRAAAARLGPEAPEFADAVATQEEMLDALEESLRDNAFLVGASISHADLVALPYVARLEQMALIGLVENSGRSNLAQWYAAMKARPSWRDTIGALPPQVVAHWQSLGRQGWAQVARHLKRMPA